MEHDQISNIILLDYRLSNQYRNLTDSFFANLIGLL